MKKTFLFSLVLFFALSGCIKKKPSVSPTSPTPEITQQTPKEVIFTATQDHQSALSLLQSQHEVVLDEYPDMGVFIKVIDGKSADDSHYWALYINGESAQTGISQITLQKNDIVELRYESF